MDTFSVIRKERFIALTRRVPSEAMPAVIEALYAGGIRILEITFDHCDADTRRKTGDALRLAAGMGMLVGAGTVLSVGDVEAAHEAGAAFIVSPNTFMPVIRRTRELGMLSVPGAYTPCEIVNAHSFGADIVKIFPVLPHQLDYVQVVMSPLAHIPFMVTGGVNPDTAPGFLAAGAVAVAAGATIVRPELVREKQWNAISTLAVQHINAIREK